MKPSSNNSIEQLLQQHVLPLFTLSDGDVIWQGDSELNTQSYVYYFCITDNNYLLVREAKHGVSDNTLNTLVIDSVIAPHQKAEPILPKDGVRGYVNISKLVPQLSGDFSMFRILG